MAIEKKFSFESKISAKSYSKHQVNSLFFKDSGKKLFREKCVTCSHMSLIRINTPFNIELEFFPASVGRRARAVLIDLSIILLYLWLLQWLLLDGLNWGARIQSVYRSLGMAVLPYLYFPVTEALMNGQTPGKRLSGIKVIDDRGNEPSLSQLAIRWLLGFGNYSVFLLPYFMTAAGATFLYFLLALVLSALFYLPDTICVLVSPSSRRIADWAAGTLVIDTRKKPDFSETIYQFVAAHTAEVRYPQVMRLSDRDLNGIRNLMAKKSNSRIDREYRTRIVKRIKEVLEIEDTGQSSEEELDFLAQLIRDYNLLTQRS